MTLELDKVTMQTFEPHVGSPFAIRNPGASAILVLDSITKLGSGSPARPTSFALYFRSDSTQTMAQQIVDLSHDELGDFSIFLVPITEPGKGVLYEAVFN
jgi:hypothetical protein